MKHSSKEIELWHGERFLVFTTSATAGGQGRFVTAGSLKIAKAPASGTLRRGKKLRRKPTLKLKNGKRVKTADVWWKKRRPEIVEDFDREIYGRMPANTPAVKWEVLSVNDEMIGEHAVTTKKLAGVVDNDGGGVPSH